MRMERTIDAAKESLGESAFQSAPRKGTMWEQGSQ
jgi:hypothetical protein